MKVLIWIVSDDKKFFQDAVTILKCQHSEIEILGPISIDKILKVDCNKVDVILVVGGKVFSIAQITNEIRRLNLPAEKLLGDWVVTIPGFTLEKYRELEQSKLSIFSMNCFGGLMFHTLGLQFFSPFVGMFIKSKDYLRFLHEPRAYMKEKLVFKEMKCFGGKSSRPVAKLGDIELNMNHYLDFDSAFKTWERRKARINWDNLFVTMYTEDEKILQEFDALPYEKKVCFVPFKSDLNSAWYINPEFDFDRAEAGFYDVVNNFGRGKYFYYDPFDMLLYGKKTQLINI